MLKAPLRTRNLIYAVLVIGLVSLLAFAYVVQDVGANIKPGAASAQGEDFTFTGLQNQTVYLTSYRGKIVLLDVMATWCIPCYEEVTHLKQIQSLYPNDVVVISTTADPTDTVAKLNQYRQNNNVTWTMTQFQPNVVATLRSTDLPTLVIFDRQGVVRQTFYGLTDVTTIVASINEIMNSY